MPSSLCAKYNRIKKFHNGTPFFWVLNCAKYVYQGTLCKNIGVKVPQGCHVVVTFQWNTPSFFKSSVDTGWFGTSRCGFLWSSVELSMYQASIPMMTESRRLLCSCSAAAAQELFAEAARQHERPSDAAGCIHGSCCHSGGGGRIYTVHCMCLHISIPDRGWTYWV